MVLSSALRGPSSSSSSFSSYLVLQGRPALVLPLSQPVPSWVGQPLAFALAVEVVLEVFCFRIYFRQFTTCRRLSSSMHIRYVMCMCRRLSSLLYNHLSHVWHIYTSTSLMCDVNNKQQSRSAGAAGAAASRGTGCTVGVGVADVVHSTWIGCRIGHWRRFIGHWRLFNWPCTGTCMDSTNIGIGCIIYTYIYNIYIYIYIYVHIHICTNYICIHVYIKHPHKQNHVWLESRSLATTLYHGSQAPDLEFFLSCRPSMWPATGIRALCDIYERLPSMFEYRMACGPPVNLFKALQLVVVSVESTFLKPYNS
jgi:hypothetical protein